MYPIYLAVLVALIASLCIFGKNFWERRFYVLLICVSTVFVVQLTTSLALRHTLPLEAKSLLKYDIDPMYVDSNYLNTEVCYAMFADSTYPDSAVNYKKRKKLDINYAEDDSFKQNVSIDTISSDSTGTIIKTTLARQFKTNTLFCKKSDGDTCVYFFTIDSDGDRDIDYFTIGNNFYITPTDSTIAQLVHYSIDYAISTNWVFKETLPIFHNYRVLYLPQEEYDNLSNSIKEKTKYPGEQKYTEQYASLIGRN